MGGVLEVPKYDLATSEGGGDPGVIADFLRLLSSTQPVSLRGEVTGHGELGLDMLDAPVHPGLVGVLFGVEADQRVPPDSSGPEVSDKKAAGSAGGNSRVGLGLWCVGEGVVSPGVGSPDRVGRAKSGGGCTQPPLRSGEASVGVRRIPPGGVTSFGK